MDQNRNKRSELSLCNCSLLRPTRRHGRSELQKGKDQISVPSKGRSGHLQKRFEESRVKEDLQWLIHNFGGERVVRGSRRLEDRIRKWGLRNRKRTDNGRESRKQLRGIRGKNKRKNDEEGGGGLKRELTRKKKMWRDAPNLRRKATQKESWVLTRIEESLRRGGKEGRNNCSGKLLRTY